MKSVSVVLTAMACLLAGGAPASTPADDLIDSARLWQAKNQPDLARLAVAKALRADPGHAEAVLMQAQFDLRAGHQALARQRLALLAERYPGSSELRQLQALFRLEQGENRQFQGAQSMARAGRPDEAVAMIRRVFPDGPPGGELSMQYYEILGASSSHWTEAETGLQRLVAASPRDPRYRLALARLLVRREASRLRGTAMLATLSEQRAGDVGVLRAAWRQALMDLDSGPSALAQIDRYLVQEPKDAQIVSWRAELAGRPARAATVARAQERPRTQPEQGVLGMTALREGRHDAAEAYFNEAAARDPEGRSKWRSLAGTARFWGLLQKARAARDGADTEAALRHLDIALRLQPGQPDALSLRADLLAGTGREAEAERIWRDILKRQRDHESSLEGLASLLARQGRKADLDALMPVGQQGKAATGLARVRARLMRQEADDLASAGQAGAAIAMLRSALSLDAANPWLRHDLARLLQRAGRADEVEEVVTPLRTASGDDLPDSRYAYALFLASGDQVGPALAMLDEVPEAARSSGMQRLRQQLLFERALARLSGGDPAAAAEAESLSISDPALSLRLARWMAASDPERARALLDARLAKVRVAGATEEEQLVWRLQQAALLDSMPDDERLTPLLVELAARPQLLTDAQHADLDRFARRQQVRGIEAAGARGDHAGARRLLAGAMSRWPGDDGLRLLQARLEADAGNTDQAIARYRALLAMRPDWTDASLGLVDACIAGDRLAEARAELAALEARLTPVVTDDDWRLALARRYQRIDRSADALRLLEAQLAIAVTPEALISRGELAESRRDYVHARGWYERALAAEGRAPLAPAETPVEQVFAGSAAERALSRLAARRDGHVQTGLIYRDKSGEDGLSTTTVTEIPTEFYLPLGYEGHVIGHLDLIEIDAGRLSSAPRDQAEFGKMLALSPAGVAARGQSASGMAVGLGYETDRWRVDLGTTPLGFLVENWVGGVRYSMADATRYRSAELFRRPVTSSLLSYAGQRDPVTGAVWGGVVSTGGSFRLSRSSGGVTRAVGGRAALLDGRSVADNRELRLTASQTHDLIDRRDMTLNAGLSLTWWQFARDLSAFTFGHGGYYSPQQYASLSLPVRWTGRWRDYAWLLAPAVSVSWARSDDSDYHPTSAGLQALAEASAAADPSLPDPVHDGSSGTSFGYSLEGALEKRLAPNWFVGGGFRLDRSPYYTPNVLQLYLRYELAPKRGLVVYPPRQLRTYADF